MIASAMSDPGIRAIVLAIGFSAAALVISFLALVAVAVVQTPEAQADGTTGEPSEWRDAA